MFDLGLKHFAKLIKKKISNAEKDLSKTENLLSLSDIRIQKRNYNSLIPIIYGEILLAGNIIWTSKLFVKFHSSEGATGSSIFDIPILDKFGIGKGFFGNRNLDPEKHCCIDIAIGIAEGSIDELIAIYINGFPVEVTSLKFTFYKGNEIQKPDPIIAKHEQIERTPAFRGLCYIVIESFDITEYGNILPKFEFLVRRTNFGRERSLASLVKHSIKGINLLPGTGEFAYDTLPVVTYGGFFYNDKDILDGTIKHSNINTFNKSKADSLIALDLLKEDLPNLKWVSVVIVWFTDSIEIANGVIYPAVEFNDKKSASKPCQWRCAGKNRWETRKISIRKDDKSLNYGGTICDDSLLRILDELHSRGYKVCLYPMIFVDTDEKPWRGRITGKAEDAMRYFNQDEGYNNFIMHYAKLTKGLANAFIIGSEMKGLTAIKESNGSYPAVEEFTKLAEKVKAEMGIFTKITYAADWSEYHSKDGFYNMDTLWASEAIDFIGIDSYFPLTEGPEKKLFEDIRKGWTSGEGYDYYFNGKEKINYQNPSFAWKNIRWFIENPHVNIDGSSTAWIPNLKKIWFTEYGFPSVELCTNQPNVFFDPNSQESFFPSCSSGHPDFTAQKLGLLSAAQFIEENCDIVENAMCWCYDLRPYPFFPARSDIWQDAKLWKTGHWINGKMGTNTFNEIVSELAVKAGLEHDEIEFYNTEEIIEGFCIAHESSALAYIEILCEIFGVKSATSAKGIAFKSFEFLHNAPVIQIEETNPLFKKSRSSPFMLEEHEIKNSFPREAVISFIDKNARYEISNFSLKPEDITKGNLPRIKITLPLVFAQGQINHLMRQALNRQYLERNIKKITLPAKYAYLQAGDIIQGENMEKIYIKHINLNENMEVITEGVPLPCNIIKRKENPETSVTLEVPSTPLPPLFFVFSIPDFFAGQPEESFYLFFSNISPKMQVFYLNPLLQIKIALGFPSTNGIRGKIIRNKLEKQYDNAFMDNESYIEVFLENKATFDRRTENLAIIGGEICFFENFEEKEEGRYSITEFARKGIILPNILSDDFILLSSCETLTLPEHIINGGEFILETEQKAIFHKANRSDVKIGSIFQKPEKNGILFYWSFIAEGDNRKFEDLSSLQVDIYFPDISATSRIVGETFLLTHEKQIELFGCICSYVNVNVTLA